LSSEFKAVNLLCCVCCIGVNHIVEGIARISNFLICLRNWNRKHSLDFVKEETIGKSEGPVSEARYLVCSCLQLLNFDWVLASDGLVGELNDEIVQVLEHILGIFT